MTRRPGAPRGNKNAAVHPVVPDRVAKRVRIVGLPRCDFLTVSGPATDPCERGFVWHEGRWWRPGWWATEVAVSTTRRVFVATAMKGSRQWPQPWGLDMHPTRVDICCDFTGFEFKEHCRELFTSRGSTSAVWSKHELQTLYVGSRKSPIMLRLYNKTNRCDEHDRATWTAHGWAGEPVWRAEFELKRRALTEDLVLPYDVEALWSDALARVRMCTVSPRIYSRQNAAPTHPLWWQLGRPMRRTRRRGRDCRLEGTHADRLKQQLERVFTAAGPATAMLLEHARKLARAS